MIATRAATRWVDSDELWWDLAQAYGAYAAQPGVLPKAAERHWREARRALERSLSLAPGNPWGWSQLAALESMTGGSRDRAAEALRLSLITGPYQPDLFHYRARLAFRLWDDLDGPTSAQLERQLVRAFQSEPTALTKLAVETGRVEVLRKSLKTLAAETERLDAILNVVAPAEWRPPPPPTSIYSQPKPVVDPLRSVPGQQAAPPPYPAWEPAPAWAPKPAWERK